MVWITVSMAVPLHLCAITVKVLHSVHSLLALLRVQAIRDETAISTVPQMVEEGRLERERLT